MITKKASLKKTCFFVVIFLFYDKNINLYGYKKSFTMFNWKNGKQLYS